MRRNANGVWDRQSPRAAVRGELLASPPRARASAHSGVEDGLIVDEVPAPGNLPERDRVTLVSRGRRVHGPRPATPQRDEVAQSGQIVEDRLDGRRIYADPPGPPVDRLGRLAGRLSPAMLPFVLLAWTNASMFVADAWVAGHWTAPGTVLLVLRLGYVCGLGLLPAAVLLWRPGAWRTNPLIFLGAVCWGTLPGLALVAGWFAMLDPGLRERFAHDADVGAAAASVAACVGPLLIALGLELARRSPASWLPPLALRVTAVAMVMVAGNAGRWFPTLGSGSLAAIGGGTDATRLALSMTGTLVPLTLVALGMLACCGVSAFSADEAQRRLWQCGTVGAALLAGVSLYELGTGDLLSGLLAGGQADLAARGWYGLPGAAVLAAGAGTVLLGFCSPVWSTAPDAEGVLPGAPEEIFAWGSTAWTGGDPIAMSAVVAVAAGENHALAIDRFGRVGAWGDNSSGQTDVPDELGGVIAVAAGDGFSLALRDDGTVAAWGSNELGETNVPEELAGVTAISAGRGFAIALKDDGTIAGWGDRCADAMKAPGDLAGVTAISAGMGHALALKLDGTVVGWGDDRYGQASVPAGIGRVKAISAGGNFSLALLDDGTVAAWGDRSFGQLDVPRGLRNVVAISAGAFHALALRADGDVVGWGGGGDPRNVEAAHPWHLVDFQAVAAGDGYSLAIRAA